jgi:hypothetical protein
MGILDWFRSRPEQAAAALPDEVAAQAIDKAVALVNPRLKLLDSCEKTLRPPIEKTVAYLRDAMLALPAPIELSEAKWASEPVLRAFFAEAREVSDVFGRSRPLRSWLDQHAGADRIFVTLGTTYNERPGRVPTLQGGAPRDIEQTIVHFSEPRVRICGLDESELRRLLGVSFFEYLVAQAMTEISVAREARRELEDSRGVIRARLRGLESAAETDEQRQLKSRLRENERRLEAHGDARSVLEYELECLRGVLDKPESYIGLATRRLRLNTLNAVVDEDSTEAAADVTFTLSDMTGVPRVRRAFVIGSLRRSDVPRVKLDLAGAERLL